MFVIAVSLLLFCSGDTTEAELCRVFSSYGNVKSTKIIVDRAGVSKGYGFVTFETEQEAQRLQAEVTYILCHSFIIHIIIVYESQSTFCTNSLIISIHFNNKSINCVYVCF